MSKINAVCVYCGSSAGTEPTFGEAAGQFGRILAESGVRLIYGGGSVGLMGILADAVLAHGGKATGIIVGDVEFALRPGLGGRFRAMVAATKPKEHKEIRRGVGPGALGHFRQGEMNGPERGHFCPRV